MGSEEEEPGVVSRFFGWLRRVACTLVCAWFEILVLVILFVSMCFLVALVFFLFFIGDSLLSALTGPGAPVTFVVVGAILFIIWLIMVLVFLYFLIQVGKWVEQKVQRCWQQC